jgi:hypothetical protein
VILFDRLRTALARINPHRSPDTLEDAGVAVSDLRGEQSCQQPPIHRIHGRYRCLRTRISCQEAHALCQHPGVGLFVVVEGPGCSIAERGWLSFPVEISEKENRLRRDIIDDKRARDHPLLVVSLGKRGEVVVKISPCSVADRDELLEAITQTVDRRPWPVSR